MSLNISKNVNIFLLLSLLETYYIKEHKLNKEILTEDEKKKIIVILANVHYLHSKHFKDDELSHLHKAYVLMKKLYGKDHKITSKFYQEFKLLKNNKLLKNEKDIPDYDNFLADISKSVHTKKFKTNFLSS